MSRLRFRLWSGIGDRRRHGDARSGCFDGLIELHLSFRMVGQFLRGATFVISVARNADSEHKDRCYSADVQPDLVIFYDGSSRLFDRFWWSSDLGGRG